MHLIGVFFFLALFSGANAGSRTDVLSLKMEFSYDPYPDRNARAVNALLLHIADGSGKLRVRTSFQVHADLLLTLERIHADSVRAGIAAERVWVTGDRHYRDFCLEKLMMPDKFSGILYLFDELGDTVYQASYRDKPMQPDGISWPDQVFFYRGALSGLGTSFTDVSMHYEGDMIRRIDRWHEALQTYYSASRKLRDIAGIIHELCPSNPGTILLDEFQLCEAEALAGRILYAPFHEWLDIGEYDPEKIGPRFYQKRLKLKELRDAFNHSIANLDSLYYEDGMRRVADEGWTAARNAFESAIQFNPFHIPSQLAISTADLENGQTVKALNRVSEVIADMQPLYEWEEVAENLADTLLSLFFKRTEELIAEDRLTASLDTLAHIRTFCQTVDGYYPCPEEFVRLLNVTHRGIFRSFLTVARRAIRNDDVGFARLYIENALDYQETHEKYVPDAFEAKDMLLTVMTRQRILADIAMLGGNYDLSADYRIRTVTLAGDHPGLAAYLKDYGDRAQLKEAVLNYAVAGYIEESLAFLRKLRNMGVEESNVAYHQRIAGQEAAIWLRNRALESDIDAFLYELTSGDPWFRMFNRSFLTSWQE